MGPKGFVSPLVMGPKGLITPKCDDSGSLVMGPKGLISRLLASRFNDRPTIALVMGLKGLISRLLPPKFIGVSLVMGLKGLISRLLAPKFIGVCPAFALDIGPKGLISHAESGRSQTGATVELHRQEYHRIFKAHAQVPFEKVTNLLQRPDWELFGVRYAFLLMRNTQRAARSGTTNDGGVENATASSYPSAPPLLVGGGGDGEGILSTSFVPTLPVGGGGDVEGIPSTPSVPPLPAGGGHHANGSMSLPTASPSTMNGMPEDREADKSMALVREEMSKRDIPAKYVTVDGRWSHVREGEWCTVSFMDIPSRKILYCVTTRKGVDDKSSVRLERVAFDRGVDELNLLGFDVKGIISDQATTFRGAAAERKLDHQVDWWHVKWTLYNLFCKELQHQVRMAVEVDKASCVEELWLVKMTPDEAKWKFPELRKVRRLGEERAAVDVPVGYGEVRSDTTGEMQPIVRDAAVDEADAGATQVDVQWADVEELWQYDIYHVRGARPLSLASSLIVYAHAGACNNLRFIDGTTPWANDDEATGMNTL
ncbi:unnamed protein product [Closterium sp. NIES-64]|nr:unnamed protein product [Closterium sp. NIES-64]